MEKIVLQHAFDNNYGSLIQVQQKTILRLKVLNFPKLKVNLDSASLMMSMLRRHGGCLLRLDNLIVTGHISTGSFARKKFFLPACTCDHNRHRCHRYSLIDSIKCRDHLSRHQYFSQPRCKVCRVPFRSDAQSDLYCPYYLVKAQYVESA